MKIKELHLRNIASIEVADIDFTRDLTDRVTGDPASVFLISGDTGAGKSVILDGISMALYHKTPRLSSLANVKQNDFSDTSGELISVGSIVQYTRLGITENDDSFSELVFEGNDGIEYRAKLTLGMKREKGTGRLVHRTPKWALKAGSADWINSKTSVGKAILAAVGLSFEQFGQMAMLAQGQFATFLTGDKKEREAILERLTCTEHFTAYGTAISNLNARAIQAREAAKSLYDNELTHTLPQEETDRLVADKEAALKLQGEITAAIKAIQDTINMILALESSHKSLDEAAEGKARIEEAMNAPAYKESVALVKDWDSTATERLKLEDMQAAAADRVRARNDEDALADTFLKLSADLLAKRETAAQMASCLAEQEAWITERANREELYSTASAADVKLGSYIKARQELADNEDIALKEKSRTVELARSYESARQAADDAGKAILAKQSEIDTLTARRQDLCPDQTNREIAAARERQSLLERMKTVAETIRSDKQTAEEINRKIENDKAALDGLTIAAKAAQEEFDRAKDADDRARKALSTMEMSIDEKIVELRRKLAADHAAKCPLCGQDISMIDIEEQDFKGILSPLQEMQERTAAELKDAEYKRDETQRRLDKTVGALTASQESYHRAMAEIAQKESALAKAGVSGDFDAMIEQVKARITNLEKTQHDAEALQTAINALLDEKKPLDIAKEAADIKAAEAKSALEKNIAQIENIEKTHESLVESISALTQEISRLMGTSWTEDAMKARETLRRESAEYNDARKAHVEATAKFDKLAALIKTIEGQFEVIADSHAEWHSSKEPCARISKDIVAEWTNLVASAQKIAGEIAGYDRTLRECSEIIERSGKDETFLKFIASKKNDVEPARELVRRMGEDLKSRNDAIAAAQTQIEEISRKLGYEIPARQDLEAQKQADEDRLAEVQKRLGVIQERLESDSRNKADLQAAKVALDRASAIADKWTKLNSIFGGTRFRTLVQTYILRPLLNNANIYLRRITDRYTLTCSEDNEQLSILVLDRYNKNQVRSATVLSGGEKFMISLALSLALSSLNRPDMNVNILFIDEGFGTLDEKNLDSVMQTLEKLQEIAGENNRRVGIISHREELDERIPVQIRVVKKGEGRSHVVIT